MLGEELRKARNESGLTQEKLAFEADLDRTYISQLENDRKSPTLDALFRIADALGVPASELVARVKSLAIPVGKGTKRAIPSLFLRSIEYGLNEDYSLHSLLRRLSNLTPKGGR
jgi:transcriptional regulator with XRE-family HTH domain